MAAKHWLCPCGKVVPISMELASKACLRVHCKREQHKDGMQCGKVVPEYFPWVAAMGSTPLLGMKIRVNERPLYCAANSARGAWAATTMAALAHPRRDLQPLASRATPPH